MALKKAGVAPIEAMHVGDQYEMDTVGALGVGMKAVLLDRYQVSQAQIDGLWAYVGHKGQKGDMAKAQNVANSGAAR